MIRKENDNSKNYNNNDSNNDHSNNINSNKNFWLDGIMGVVVGDALGCPVQFLSREEIRRRGAVTGMEGYGTYNMPPGTWTDDSSLALAALDSIRELGTLDPEDIMTRFVDWYEDGEYTPFGMAFDIGHTCSMAIERYENEPDIRTCGGTNGRSNGNGSLMRILPVCLHAYEMQREGMPDAEAVSLIHTVSGLTHNHLRSRIACGLYYFCVRAALNRKAAMPDLQSGAGNMPHEPQPGAENAMPDPHPDAGNTPPEPQPDAEGMIPENRPANMDNAMFTLLRAGGNGFMTDILQSALDAGFAFYEKDICNLTELAYYGRLRNLTDFAKTPENEIKSSGYVVDSLEAAIWSLITTDSFEAALLKAVNLGGDTDTIAAIAGGLAGLFYGYDRIPAEWLAVIQKREWIEELCCQPISQED